MFVPITLGVGRRVILLVSLLVLLVVGALVLLPAALAPIASERLSDALGTPVRIGRISASPFGPRVSAYGFTLRLAEDEEPQVSFAALHADIALGRLLRGELALDRLTLVQPHVAVRRTAAGDLNLAALLPPEPEGPPEPRPETEPDTTPVEIAELRLRDGTVEFHDATATPPIASTARIDRARADDLHLTLGGDADVELQVTSRIDDNPFELDLRYLATGGDSTLALRLRTAEASLGRVLVHARLDWEHVAGTVEAELGYDRIVEAGELATHRLTVDATASDLSLAESAAEEATFRAETATLEKLTVDLTEQRVHLGTISAEDFWGLAYQDDAGLQLPFVPSGRAPDEEPSDWRVAVGTITLGTGTLLLRNLPAKSADLPVAVRSGRIEGEGRTVDFVFDTEIGTGGFEIKGEADGATTKIQLTLDALEVPGLTAHLRSPVVFASGTVDATLHGVFGDGPPEIQGRLVATDVKTAPRVDHPEEVFAWATLELDLGPSTVTPPRFHIKTAKLEWPYLMLHRRPDGVYPFSGVATEPPSADADQDPPTPVDLRVDRLTIAHGRVEFYDTVFDDAYGADLLELEGSVEDLRSGPVRAARFELTGSIDELSPVRAEGNLGNDMDSEIEVDRLRLVPLTRYIEPGINYNVTAGTASIDTQLSKRSTKLTADNEIDLRRLKLKASGTDPFKGELGVALPVALSLMKDSRGHITLDLPVTLDLDTKEYTLGASLVTAVQQAFLGTLQSPVKILGAVLLNDDGEVFDLKPIPFAPGSATLEGKGAERLARVASLLEKQPGLELLLFPITTPADAAALAAAEDTARTAENARALGVARGKVIEEELRVSYGIDPERVRRRKPRSDDETDATPGVDVQLRGH